MKRKSLFLMTVVVFFLLPFSAAKAQTPQVNNSGFENWDNLGTSDVEPSQWNSFMTADATFLTQFGKKQRVDRRGKVRPGTTGNYSAVIWSTNELGTIANGNMTTGKINMGSTTPSSSDNYNFSKMSDANHHETLGGQPDSLVVWVYFKPVSTGGTDAARVRAVIHDAYDLRDPLNSGSTGHVVGDATLNFTSPTNQWSRKSIPFNYSGPATNPAYILISFTTNAIPGGGSAADSLYIDDLTLVYNPSLAPGIISLVTYNVSATQSAGISIPFNLTGTMWPGNTVYAELSDATGSFANPVVLGSLATTSSGTISGTIPAGTPTGTAYRIRVRSTDYAITSADNGADISIQLVSNSISPSAVQNIEENQAGAAIDVTETPSGTSREWKHSTTSGGPYNSFVPAETGLAYTPLFASQGTYYVICESVIGGLSVLSGEVTVNVSPAAGIGDTYTNNPQVFASGENLIVDLRMTGLDQPTMQIFDRTGRLVESHCLSNDVLNILSTGIPAGLFIYRIITGDAVLSGKLIRQ